MQLVRNANGEGRREKRADKSGSKQLDRRRIRSQQLQKPARSKQIIHTINKILSHSHDRTPQASFGPKLLSFRIPFSSRYHIKQIRLQIQRAHYIDKTLKEFKRREDLKERRIELFFQQKRRRQLSRFLNK